MRPSVRVRRLRGADAGLPLLPRTRPAVDARARGLICRARPVQWADMHAGNIM